MRLLEESKPKGLPYMLRTIFYQSLTLYVLNRDWSKYFSLGTDILSNHFKNQEDFLPLLLFDSLLYEYKSS